MSSLPTSHHLGMRRSQRRKNKMLSKADSDYSIPNPYQALYSQQCIPDTLGKQLSRLEYLSTKSLQNLDFPSANNHHEMNDILAKMKCAAKKQ